jgi:uncharacterized RDD family membrane protein YckC
MLFFEEFVATAFGLSTFLNGLIRYFSHYFLEAHLLGVVTIYYLIQEQLWGKTLGKRITHTRVISANGEKPSFGQILGRTLARFIPFDPFCYLFMGSYPVGIHDKVSNTCVVEDRR